MYLNVLVILLFCLEVQLFLTLYFYFFKVSFLFSFLVDLLIKILLCSPNLILAASQIFSERPKRSIISRMEWLQQVPSKSPTQMKNGCYSLIYYIC